MQMRRGMAALTLVLSVTAVLAGSKHVLPVAAASPVPNSHVCGQLSGDATWTAATGPYEIDCDVIVPADATLTIEPGAVVYGIGTVSTTIQVAGKLIANGTSAAPITFSWSGPCCTQENGIQFLPKASTASSLSYAEISGAHFHALVNYPGASLDHMYFHDNQTSAIDTFPNFHYPAGAALTIDHSTFSGNGISVGLQVGDLNLTVQNSAFSNGVSTDLPTFSLRDIQSSTIHINNNNIVNNKSQLDLDLLGNPYAKVDATNNWWGTTDRAVMRARIRDCTVDRTRPCASFEPWFAIPISSAPSGATPTVTLTATATSTATNTPTRTPTQGPTSTVTPTPTEVVTATPTATATATITPTSTPAPPSVSIDKVLILRTVKGQHVSTGQHVHLREPIDFYVLYHLTNPGKLVPSATLSITKNGKPLVATPINSVFLGKHPAFGARVTFKTQVSVGLLYAHFRITLGKSVLKRDRRVYVQP